MCYSALIKRDIDRLAREFGASVDIESFVEIYQLRGSGTALKIPSAIDSYFLNANGAQFGKIQALIRSFDEVELAKRRVEISDAGGELLDLENKFKIKPTKTTEKAIGVKLRKLEKLKAQEQELASKFEPSTEPYRMYPYYFAPVIYRKESGEHLVRPMRYRILPANGEEIPNEYNVFNARRDSLLERKTWRDLFGKNHVLFPFIRFFEWVEAPGGGKREITFTPDGYDSMWAPGLFSETPSGTGKIRSFAMVTDNPPPEVSEAGHDRCPIFLAKDQVENWLTPEGKSPMELDQLLEHKQKTHYSHLPAT